jgi:GrpB-like predicted nucleotidyltransferase (UPF0157 family)
MPTRDEILTFGDTPPPPGASPWVVGAEPVDDVELADPDPQWIAWYDEVSHRVRSALGVRALHVEHVGSTSVPGMPAKPVVDVDLLVADPDDEDSYVPALNQVGFVLRIREPWWYRHRMLRSESPRCNLHVFGYDSPEPLRHRLFREWLTTHPGDRGLYAQAKRQAALETSGAGEHVSAYNARKQAVVREIYARAFAAAGFLPPAAH